MRKTYRTFRNRARNMPLGDWGADAPTTPYYKYPPSFSPHPMMGLGRFVAGKIPKMGARKSTPATHPAWFQEEHNSICTRCGNGPDSFPDAILAYPA